MKKRASRNKRSNQEDNESIGDEAFHPTANTTIQMEELHSMRVWWGLTQRRSLAGKYSFGKKIAEKSVFTESLCPRRSRNRRARGLKKLEMLHGLDHVTPKS
jgi:hypothetical protein